MSRGAPASTAQPEANLAALLDGEELASVLTFCNDCLVHAGEEQLDAALMRLAARLGFEFVRYAWVSASYGRDRHVELRNLSNPVAWMEEYAARGFLDLDPVRRELERRLARAERRGVIVWDAYDRPLSAPEAQVIERRRAHGLVRGFSAFCDSPRHDASFLVSFATARDAPLDDRALLIGDLVVPHLNRCRKRLDLSGRVARLTERERAVADLIVDGKTNGEIAQLLGVSGATAKFHVANVLGKLETPTRQAAASVLMAERCLA